MKKSRFTEEQITYALRQAEGGTPVADACRQLRDECLNVNQFLTIEDARATIEAWRLDYNHHRATWITLTPDTERIHPKSSGQTDRGDGGSPVISGTKTGPRAITPKPLIMGGPG